MIKLTEEILYAALDAYDQHCPDPRSEDGFRLAVAAVLAIVERDWVMRPRRPSLRADPCTDECPFEAHSHDKPQPATPGLCGVAGPDGLTCQRAPGHLSAPDADAKHGAYSDAPTDDPRKLVRW